MNLSIKELNELIYSLGTTATKGMLCDKELNNTLLDKLYAELNHRLLIQSDITNEVIEIVKSQNVSNERDYSAFQQYADAKPKDRFNGVSQFILNFVEANGVVSYTEMNDMYKAYTKGSNSFSHILKALMIPYKNRPTLRYLTKTSFGSYMVRIAQPQNWVIK